MREHVEKQYGAGSSSFSLSQYSGALSSPSAPKPSPPPTRPFPLLHFLPLPQPANPYGPVPRRWRGKCQATRDFPQSLCSRKLIGARFFAAGVRKSSAGVNKEKDFMSPRDGDGHGTWCARRRTFCRLATGTSTARGVPGVRKSSAGVNKEKDFLSPRDGDGHGTWCARCVGGWGEGGGWVGWNVWGQSVGVGWLGAGVRKSSAGVNKAKDFLSPRDGDGHGTCVDWRAGDAAAGNANVPLTLSPTRTLGSISGVAPRARLATYKALWVTPAGEAGAFQSDIRAAVDAAVSDGVDVLSCSFGGAISRYFNDLPYLQALKVCRCGGWVDGRLVGRHLLVFTAFSTAAAAAAAAAALLTPSLSPPPSIPWPLSRREFLPFFPALPTLSPPPPPISTIGRDYQANLTLGNGVQLTGLGFGSAGNARDLPLVLSSAAVHPLGTLSLARECFASSLDKAKLSGRTLVCNLKTRDVREAMRDTTTTALGAAAVLLLSASANLPCHVSLFLFPLPPLASALYAPPQARECFASSLDKSKLSGRMLVCNLKTRDVREAMRDTTTPALGAAAVLLLSASASSLAPSRVPYTDVPAIHLNAEDSETVRQYLSKATNPTASLSPPFTTFSDEAPSVAYFSSTGPPLNPAFPVTPRLLASNDILKPDIIGPGFQLWAASRGLKPSFSTQSSESTQSSSSTTTTPTTPSSSSELPKFGYLSGTSMATPHLAGIAALIIQKHPNWSPAQIASAIMTTAYTTNRLGNPIRRTTSSGKKSTGKTVEATPWDMGSGQVDPMRVLNPGLTFHVGYKDYVNFLAARSYFYTMMNFPGVGGIRPVKAFNLNRPSISISRLSRPVVVRRVVKNVDEVPETYRAIIRGPSGVKIDVNPMSFTINPGQTQKFSVRFWSKGKPNRVFKFGSLVWRGNQSHIVRMVIAIRTVPLTQFLS
ncbi:unnamed protein product [Closterium sp. NIES-54]